MGDEEMSQEETIKALEDIIEYPPEGHPRRDVNGFPFEICYDQFAYERIVTTYREAIKFVIDRINN